MMISHMQAAARHLDDGSEHLARTMDRLARELPGRPQLSGGPQPQAALPGQYQR